MCHLSRPYIGLFITALHTIVEPLENYTISMYESMHREKQSTSYIVGDALRERGNGAIQKRNGNN